MSSSISKSKFEVSWSASASPSLGFGLSLQTKVVTEICSELGCGVVDGVGGHTKCLRDGICPELQGGDIPLELEKVVEKGCPLTVLSTTELWTLSIIIDSKLIHWNDCFNFYIGYLRYSLTITKAPMLVIKKKKGKKSEQVKEKEIIFILWSKDKETR